MIHVVAFNGARDDAQRRRFSALPGQGPHEAAQADNIRAAAAERPYDRVLVLVGGTHASKSPVERGGVSFEPMAMRLGPAASIVSLTMRTAGGASWNCQTKPGVAPRQGKPISSGDLECGAFPVRAHDDVNRSPFIALGGIPGSGTDPGYDGMFWLGVVRASPPAVRDADRSGE